MKQTTPIQVALKVALSIGVAAALLLLIVHFFVSAINWWAQLVVLIVTTSVAFGVVYYAIEAFINSRIKVIYKTIHTLKSPKSGVKDEIDMRKDILGEVNREVKSWAEEKAEEIGELRKRDDFRKEFIGNLAHELKTPIFNIQGYILTLLEGALDDPEINHKFLMRASNSVDRMILITNDLDTISRLESGSIDLRIERIDVVELAREVIEGVEMTARARNVKVQLDKKYDKPIWVKADRFRISQVFTNLVSNAIKYGKAGGNCTISFFDFDENILIEVSDDGPGIAADHLPRLFERFYRVDKSRAKNMGGTGLGLAIAKHIVEAHGQSITVRSQEGEGTTLSFTLKKG